MAFDHEAAGQLLRSPIPPSDIGRPTIVTIACIIVGGHGLLAAVSGSLGALAHIAMGNSPLPSGLGAAGWLFERFLLGASIQALLGAVTVLCGAGIWKRFRWARRCGQAVMLVWALLSLALGIGMAVSGPVVAEGAPVAFLSLWRATALVTSATLALTLLVPVWLLTRREAREWFTRDGRQPALPVG